MPKPDVAEARAVLFAIASHISRVSSPRSPHLQGDFHDHDIVPVPSCCRLFYDFSLYVALVLHHLRPFKVD